MERRLFAERTQYITLRTRQGARSRCLVSAEIACKFERIVKMHANLRFADYAALAERLNQHADTGYASLCCRSSSTLAIAEIGRLIYLSVPPSTYVGIAANINTHCRFAADARSGQRFAINEQFARIIWHEAEADV